MLLKNLLYQIAWALLAIAFLATLFPIFGVFDDWYIKMLDFPRLQILTMALIAVIIFTIFYFFHSKKSSFALILCGLIILYQGYRILPYTNFVSTQTKVSERSKEDALTINILISNVLMKNTEYEKLVAQIKKYDPDLVLLLEPDEKWQKALQDDMTSYIEQVSIPLKNTYGMILYSKLNLSETEVNYLIEPDLPSISTKVTKGSLTFQLYCIHPRPPFFTEATDSEERDAEIILTGKMAKKQKIPVIVAGDFNDVAWSDNTTLFQKTSGLLDPRVGRGFYNTYSASNPLLRWPLDHVFHSTEFFLLAIERLPSISSDHFPVYIELSYEPENAAKQSAPKKSPHTDKKSNEVIRDGVTDTD